MSIFYKFLLSICLSLTSIALSSSSSLLPSFQASSCTPSLDSSNSNELRDQRKLPVSGWLEIFLNAVEKLQKQVEDGSGDKFLVWDKVRKEKKSFWLTESTDCFKDGWIPQAPPPLIVRHFLNLSYFISLLLLVFSWISSEAL
ncbi:unnamed protein product [Trichobilharzia regenti]|nr:unnamed protein product [Trichobilharzia regenti]